MLGVIRVRGESETAGVGRGCGMGLQMKSGFDRGGGIHSEEGRMGVVLGIGF